LAKRVKTRIRVRARISVKVRVSLILTLTLNPSNFQLSLLSRLPVFYRDPKKTAEGDQALSPPCGEREKNNRDFTFSGAVFYISFSGSLVETREVTSTCILNELVSSLHMASGFTF